MIVKIKTEKLLLFLVDAGISEFRLRKGRATDVKIIVRRLDKNIVYNYIDYKYCSTHSYIFQYGTDLYDCIHSTQDDINISIDITDKEKIKLVSEGAEFI